MLVTSGVLLVLAYLNGEAAPLQPASELPTDAESNTVFTSSPIVARVTARYFATCIDDPASARVLQRVKAGYASLDRVLLIDGTQSQTGVNGLGNLFGDYTMWVAIAAATERALFIDWTDGGAVKRYDLGYYFTGDTFDWAWEGPARELVEARHGSPTVLELPAFAKDASQPTSCISIWETLQGDDSWVKLELKPESSIAMFPLCSNASSMIADTVNVDPPTSDHTETEARALQRAMTASKALLEGGVTGAGRLVKGGLDFFALLGLSYRAAYLAVQANDAAGAARMLPTLLRNDRASTLQELRDGRGWWQRVGDELPQNEEKGKDVARLGRCLLNLYMQPRLRLRQALAPSLKALTGADSLVSLHVRTGWADDVRFIPDELEGSSANASAVLMGSLAPRDSAAYQEFQASEREKRGVFYGEAEETHAVEKIRSLLGSDGLSRTLLHLTRLIANAPSVNVGLNHTKSTASWAARAARSALYGRLDPLQVLLSAEARWQLLNTVDHAGFQRLLWPIRTHEEALQDCMQLAGRSESQGPILPALRVANPAWEADTVNSSAPVITPLAAAVECSAILAAAVATQRAEHNVTGATFLRGSQQAAQPSESSKWMLHISSDAPGLVSMFEELQALKGHVLGCVGVHCVEHDGANSQHSQRADRSSSDSMQLSVEVWLQAAADHLLQVSKSTLVQFAARSAGSLRTSSGDAVSHNLDADLQLKYGFAGDKHLPVCTPLPEPRVPGEERPPSEECLALRWAVLSSVAARALRDGSRTQAVLQNAVTVLRTHGLLAAQQ